MRRPTNEAIACAGSALFLGLDDGNWIEVVGHVAIDHRDKWFPGHAGRNGSSQAHVPNNDIGTKVFYRSQFIFYTSLNEGGRVGSKDVASEVDHRYIRHDKEAKALSFEQLMVLRKTKGDLATNLLERTGKDQHTRQVGLADGSGHEQSLQDKYLPRFWHLLKCGTRRNCKRVLHTE